MTKQDIKEELYGLPFDQFSRQYRVAQIIDSYRNGSESFTILDVGGYKGKTTEFHPSDSVTIVDLFKDKKLENYIQTDGKKLPFDDNYFDFVVTFDTYEHVPRANRKLFIRELDRVAKKGVLLAAPFDDEKELTTESEIGLNEFHQKLYKKQHRWLKEHIEYKIPLAKDFEKSLTAAKIHFTSILSNELTVWSQMQTIQFSIELDDEYRGRVDLVNRFYNKNIDKVDTPSNDESAYRRIYFIGSDKAAVASAEEYIKQLHMNRDYSARLRLTLMIMDSFGVKYRDVITHRNYLENEIVTLKNKNSNYLDGLKAAMRLLKSQGSKVMKVAKRGKE